MKDSGIPWIGMIPEDWEYLKFKFSGTFEKGKLSTSTNVDGIGFPIIGASEMNGKSFTLYTEQEDIPKCSKDDILILWDGANAGLIANNLYGIVSSTVVKYSCIDKRSNLNYVYYQLKTLERYFRSKVSGTTIPHMNMKFINESPLLLPPLPTQQHIAKFLDRKCAEINEMTSLQETMIAELKRYKQSVITEAVTKGLNKNVPMKDSGVEWIGEIPEGWEVKIGKLIFRQRNEKGNDNAILLAASQKFGMVPQSMIEGVVQVKLDTDFQSFKTVHKLDYVISLRSFQGGFELSEYEGVCSPAYQVFYATAIIYPKYYKFLFKSFGFISKINSLIVGIREGKNIQYKDFAQSKIPIPPLPEQQEIADYLDTKCAEIDGLIAIKQQKIEALKEFKKSIIFEYVTGKKEVME